MRLVTAPATLTADLPRPWVFLAGAIDQDRAERWQDQMAHALNDLPGTVLNPRREAWDATWGTGLDDPRFAEQVAWELDGLERADLIACWLPATSQAPVSLLELGLHARGGRLVAGCQPGFHRQGNVAAVCLRFGVPLVEGFAELIAAIRDRMAKPTRAQDLTVMDPIRFYATGDAFGEFSNFAAFPIDLDGQRWPTTEHYFQAQKFSDPAYREQIRLTESPMVAARLGRSRKVPMRPDWEEVKDDVMRRAVAAKFAAHPGLAELLRNTGNRPLIEQTTDDHYWGCGTSGTGRNMLGVILMEIRSTLLPGCASP